MGPADKNANAPTDPCRPGKLQHKPFLEGPPKKQQQKEGKTWGQLGPKRPQVSPWHHQALVTLTSPQTQTPSPLYVIMLNHVLNKALKIKLLHKLKLAALSHKKLSFIHEETFISACSLNRVQMICGCFSLKAMKMCSESSGWLFAKTKLYLTGENSLLKWTSNTRKDISNTCKTDRISLKIGFE